MKKKNLPKDLRFKLRTYMHFYLDLKANNKSDEAKVLDWLSIPLREEMLGITRGKVFENCQTFKKLYKSKILNEISKLIKIQRFAPDDIVFEEEEKSYTIYFIIGGIVEVYHKNTTTVFKELSDNACFGEIGFFAMHPRTASVRSVTYSDMMSIERGDLEELLKTKPEANLRTKYLFNYCQRDVDSKYAILGIKCYLCGTLGHTSNSCYKVVVKADLNELKNKWVNDRQFGKKLRNVTFQSLKNMRKTKNLKIRADPKRVLGIPRPVEDAWKNKKTLIDKINLFIDEEDEDEIFEPSKTLQNTFKNYENVIGHLTSESSEDLESLRAIFKPRMSPDLMVRPENIIKSRSIRERDE